MTWPTLRCLWALGTAAAVPLAAAQFSFDIQSVLADHMWNNPTSVAVGPDGVIHLAYMAQFDVDQSGSEIWYANNAGGAWNFTRITNDAMRQEFPHLVLDQAGVVHIAFHTNVGGANKIQYTYNAGGGFVPLIDITGTSFVIVKFDVDSTGMVHFVFRSQISGAPEDIYYRTYSPASGLGPLVNLTNTPTQEESEPDIMIGPDDVVHIVYHVGSAFGGPLKYLNNASGSFQEVPTGVNNDIVDPIVLVSPDNVVSIAYRTCGVCSSASLAMISDDGTGVFGPPVNLTPPGQYFPAFYNRFAIDRLGRRYFAFASNRDPMRGIFFIGETAGGFSDPIQISATDTGNQGTSIAVNDCGKIVVSYSISDFDPVQDIVFADIFAATTHAGDLLPGDLDADGDVDLVDLSTLLNNFGSTGGGLLGDLDADGDVDLVDLSTLLSNFGVSCL